jgi:hypothetical protein
VKKYNYRFVLLWFDRKGNMALPPLDKMPQGTEYCPLQPGERIYKMLGDDMQYDNSVDMWYASVLLESESMAYPIGHIDRDELNQILRGGRSGQ